MSWKDIDWERYMEGCQRKFCFLDHWMGLENNRKQGWERGLKLEQLLSTNVFLSLESAYKSHLVTLRVSIEYWLTKLILQSDC